MQLHLTTSPRLCTIFSCGRPHYALDLCKAHYKRKKKGAYLNSPIQQHLPSEARFWSKVSITSSASCWLWTGPVSTGGYGRFKKDSKAFQAHRIAYELLIGPIPEGLDIDHLCRTRICVNPKHMEPVTRRENILRGEGPTAKHARATHCPKNHAYVGDNILRSKQGRGCRTCANARRVKQRRESFDAAIAAMEAGESGG